MCRFSCKLTCFPIEESRFVFAKDCAQAWDQLCRCSSRIYRCDSVEFGSVLTLEPLLPSFESIQSVLEFLGLLHRVLQVFMLFLELGNDWCNRGVWGSLLQSALDLVKFSILFVELFRDRMERGGYSFDRVSNPVIET